MLMKRLFVVLLVVLVLTAVGAGAGVLYLSGKVNTSLSLQQETLFTIDKGSNAYRTIKQLRNKGYTNVTPLVGKLWLKFFAGNTSVKSGTYMIKPGDSLVSVFNTFTQGEEYLFAVSLVEGLTLSQWIELLNGHGELVFDIDRTTLKQSVGQSTASWCCQGIEHNEGLYLADTYFFTKGTKASEILSRAHSALVDYIAVAWQQRAVDLPLHSPYEALVLASIIEKETAMPEERDLIAGVFVNRLNSNMRLQTDPTVIYGIGPSFDGNITRKHLRTPTPYNTYVIKGLPPTPIAMAGKAAIDAALQPQETDALYFVAKGDGSHQFSTTLEAHNAAVRKYQLKR
jgi:UPF0755 protein